MKYLFALVMLLAIGCAHITGCAHTTPATCATACANGAGLGCTWAEPTTQGAACTVVCQNASATIPWDVSTLTAATSCQSK